VKAARVSLGAARVNGYAARVSERAERLNHSAARVDVDTARVREILLSKSHPTNKKSEHPYQVAAHFSSLPVQH